MKRMSAITMTAVIAFATQAHAQAPGGANGSAGQLLFFGQLLAVFAIMYFLLIRPQQKKQDAIKKMQAALKKGDRVITQAGIIGTVANVTEDIVLLKVDGENKLEMLRSAILGPAPERK